YEGKADKAIGSPHSAGDYTLNNALAIQGMTGQTAEEKNEILALFKTTDAGENLMHEGFHVDDPKQYTRPWFSWANSMFSEFILHLNGIHVKGSPLATR